MNKKGQGLTLLIILILIAIVIIILSGGKIPTTQNITLPSYNITFNGTINKTALCSYDNLPYPDFNCSSGSSFQFNDTSVICVKGYTATVRNVSEKLKNQVYAEYGVISHTTGEYEIDHIIPLELGGDNDISNLYPEPSNIPYGFHEKDKVENLLHAKFCKGEISLQQAQYDIVYNWTKWV